MQMIQWPDGSLDTSETAARDAKCDTDAMDGLQNWSDVSRKNRDVPSIRNGMDTTANATGPISTRRNTTNLSVEARKCDKTVHRSCASTPSMCIHVHGIVNDSRRPEKTLESIRKPQNNWNPLVEAQDCTQRLRNLRCIGHTQAHAQRSKWHKKQ